MIPRRTPLLQSALIATLMLAALVIPVTVFAQDATAQPASAQQTPAATVTPGTPAPTLTPAPTPTATPTFTAVQNQLVLAQTYLDGKDYARAAALFAAVAEVDRGNAVALAGLKAALDGQGVAAAPTPASTSPSEPITAPQPAAESAAGSVWSKLINYGSTVVAGLIAVVLVYLLASAFRWLLYGARELWLMRVRPWFHHPAVQPGFLIGEFVNGLGEDAGTLPNIVAQALVEKLMQWNQLVQAREIPVEPAPALDSGWHGLAEDHVDLDPAPGARLQSDRYAVARLGRRVPASRATHRAGAQSCRSEQDAGEARRFAGWRIPRDGQRDRPNGWCHLPTWRPAKPWHAGCARCAT